MGRYGFILAEFQHYDGPRERNESSLTNKKCIKSTLMIVQRIREILQTRFYMMNHVRIVVIYIPFKEEIKILSTKRR